MTRGYHNYKGRSGRNHTLMAIVLALLLLVSLGYLFVQNNLVYDSEGNAVINWPFFSDKDGEEPNLPPEDSQDDEVGDDFNLIIEKPQLPAEEEKKPEPEEQPLRAEETVLSEFRGNPVPGANCNAVVLELKGSMGTLAYQSALAAEGGKAPDAVSRDSLTTLLSGERDWRAVAALHTLHDTYYAFANMTGAGICQPTGYIWYDYSNSHWLQPEKEGAKTYFYAMAQECEAMGFDEILLRELTYPVSGKLHKIDYSGMTLTKTEALTGFLRGLRDTLQEDTVLSLQLSEKLILAGADADTGQDISLLLPLLDRVWVETEDPDAVWVALEPHVPAGAKREQFLVVIGGEVDTGGSVLLAE